MTRDREALAELFEDGAVLATADELQASGADEIARVATSIWRTYVANPRQVFQAGTLPSSFRSGPSTYFAAEVTAAGATHSRLDLHDPSTKEEH